MKKYDNLKDRLISLYCDNDDLKPKLQHPSDYDGNWCVTNGHIAISIPHELITPHGESKLGYQGLWANPLPEPKLFTLDAFKLALKEIPCKPDYFYSYVDCGCKSGGCKRCDYEGTRTIKGKKNGLLKYEVEDYDMIYIKLGNAFFEANIIYKVIYAIELLGLELSIIQLTHHSEKNQSIIKVGDVQIIFMPVNNPYNEPAYAEIF
jgi:hypothetical protein